VPGALTALLEHLPAEQQDDRQNLVAQQEHPPAAWPDAQTALREHPPAEPQDDRQNLAAQKEHPQAVWPDAQTALLEHLPAEPQDDHQNLAAQQEHPPAVWPGALTALLEHLPAEPRDDQDVRPAGAREPRGARQEAPQDALPAELRCVHPEREQPARRHAAVAPQVFHEAGAERQGRPQPSAALWVRLRLLAVHGPPVRDWWPAA
jgi:hypothetical protein